jgi:5-methylcytosine-specific restriction endonuclease McrA
MKKKAKRKATAARQKAKACRSIPGIEYLAADPCAYCGDSLPTTHDHIDPVSKGGEHDLYNLVRCCRRCNFAKGTQTLLVFLARRALRRVA